MGTRIVKTGNLGLENADLTWNSCFCTYVLLRWVESGNELSMCIGNGENAEPR